MNYIDTYSTCDGTVGIYYFIEYLNCKLRGNVIMASPNKTRVQVATDPAFSNIVHDVEGAYTTALQIAEEVLPQGVNLYARGMHGHPTTGDSSWSTTVQFQIKLAWSNWDGSANGIEYSLNSVLSLYDNAVALSDNKVLVVYRNNSDNSLYAIILNITNTIINVGTPVKCNSTLSSFMELALLAPNKVVVVYVAPNNDNNIYSLMLTIDNDIVTPVSPAVLCVGHHAYRLGVGVLTESKVIVCYSNHSHNAYAYSLLLNISGTTITPGSVTFDSGIPADNTSLVTLSDTRAVKFCSLWDGYYYLYCQVIDVNGSVKTLKSLISLHNNNCQYIDAVALTSNKVVVVYANLTQGGSLYTILVSIDDNGAITKGAAIRCTTTNNAALSIVKLSDDKALVCYSDITNNGYLYSIILEIIDDVLIPSTPVQCNNSNTGKWASLDVNATKIGNNIFVVYNKGVNTTLYGKVLVG